MGNLLTNALIRKANIRHIYYVYARWREVDYFKVDIANRKILNCRLEIVFYKRRRLTLYYESLDIVWNLINQPIFERRLVYWFGRKYKIRGENDQPCFNIEKDHPAN